MGAVPRGVNRSAPYQASTSTSELAIASIKSHAPGRNHRNSPEERTTSSPPPSAVIQTLPAPQVILPPFGRCARSTIPLRSWCKPLTNVVAVFLRDTLRANRIARRINPSPGIAVGESWGVRVSSAMAAETPLLPLAPDANVCRPSLKTASVMEWIVALVRGNNRFRESNLYPVQMR
jgi:hypothetical protein